MEGRKDVAREALSSYFKAHDKDITQEQASYLANFSIEVLQTAGQVAVHQVAANRFNAVKKGAAGKASKAAAKQRETFNFTKATLKHMDDPNRSLPVSILKDAVKNSKGLPDPQGTKALMHYTQITRNRKKYNLEVLYDQSTNTIMHFKYTRDPIGPLKAIPK